jgi:hypothetical protein
MQAKTALIFPAASFVSPVLTQASFREPVSVFVFDAIRARSSMIDLPSDLYKPDRNIHTIDNGYSCMREKFGPLHKHLSQSFIITSNTTKNN